MSATSPELYRQLKQDVERYVTSINTHTVNLVEMVSYVKRMSFVSLKDIQQEFGFDEEDMEELEYSAYK